MLLGTVIFRMLAGYALARLRFRGRGTLFATCCSCSRSFQFLIIPIYVIIVRDYGLADAYLGMILPFPMNSTAVFVFAAVLLGQPRTSATAALDGAGELRILSSVALPLVRPRS